MRQWPAEVGTDVRLPDPRVRLQDRHLQLQDRHLQLQDRHLQLQDPQIHLQDRHLQLQDPQKHPQDPHKIRSETAGANHNIEISSANRRFSLESGVIVRLTLSC
jgi:hypothetical protein